jgi:hypothetical protein
MFFLFTRFHPFKRASILIEQLIRLASQPGFSRVAFGSPSGVCVSTHGMQLHLWSVLERRMWFPSSPVTICGSDAFNVKDIGCAILVCAFLVTLVIYCSFDVYVGFGFGLLCDGESLLFICAFLNL